MGITTETDAEKDISIFLGVCFCIKNQSVHSHLFS